MYAHFVVRVLWFFGRLLYLRRILYQHQTSRKQRNQNTARRFTKAAYSNRNILMAWDPVSAIAETVGKVLDRVLPDKAANDAAKAELNKMALAGDIASVTGQLQIDIEEAKSQSTFVAGWRPFIGWVCGTALAIDFIIRPFAMWFCSLMHWKADFPTLDMTELMPLVTAMLGMTAAHAYQDIQNKKLAVNGNGK
jgi:hypothetical protein